MELVETISLYSALGLAIVGVGIEIWNRTQCITKKKLQSIMTLLIMTAMSTSFSDEFKGGSLATTHTICAILGFTSKDVPLLADIEKLIEDSKRKDDANDSNDTDSGSNM